MIRKNEMVSQNEENLYLDPDCDNDRNLEIRFVTLETKLLTALKGLAPVEKPVEIKSIYDWIVYQLKTFNWINLGVVIILFLSLQTIQQQSADNNTALRSISANVYTLQDLQAKVQSSLGQAELYSANVSHTNAQFFGKANSASTSFIALNNSATTQFIHLSKESIEELMVLNGSAHSLYEKSIARSNLPMKQTIFLASSTFTLSSNPTPLYLKVRLVGGGGGGSGSSPTNDVGSPGESSIFGSNLLVAGGGSGGRTSTDAGGTGSIANVAGVSGFTIAGGTGQTDSSTSSGVLAGGIGGSSALGGGGAHAGASPNTGGGGGGAYYNTNNGCGSGWNGCGGGAGAYVEAIITQPSSSYSVTVGRGGNPGVPSNHVCGVAGGAGGSGIVIVEEYFH